MIKKILFDWGRGLGLAIAFTCNTIGQAQIPPYALELNYLKPATYLIEDIQIVGTQSLEPEVLLAISNLSIGDTLQIPGTTISQAIEKLWQQKIIKEVSIYASQVIENRLTLSIHIVESPRLSNCIFVGITKREEKKLAEKISLVKGKIITPKLIKYVKNTLKKHFLEQGYRNVEINVTSLTDPVDAAYNELKIHINKGEKFIINKIIIKGNNYISTPLLKATLQHFQEKPRFTLIKDILYKICTLQPIRKGGIFWNQPDLEQAIAYVKDHCILYSSKLIQEKYVEDKKRIIAYYQSQGYRDATIVKDTIYKVGDGLLNIEINIQEGEKYYIRNIKWVGNYIHTATTLNKILNIRPGSLYSPALLQERLMFNPTGKDVSSLYMDDGYLFFNIEPIEVAIEGNQVDLELRVHEGTQATISNIYIRGNTYTHESVIRRELKTLPGDKFSRTKLIRSQRELAMLNVFDPNKIEIIPVPNPANNTVMLTYLVKEAPKFDAKVGFSLASAAQFGIYADLGTNNFSLGNLLSGKLPIGAVQSLHIKAEFFGINHQDFTLQFSEPWLTGKRPTAVDLAINKSFQQYKNEKKKKHSSLGSLGIKTGLGKRLTWPDDYFYIKPGLSYRIYDYQNYAVLYNLYNKKKLTGTTHELSISLVLERNDLDQLTYPTKGSLATLKCKLTPPYSLFSQQPTGKVNIQEQLKKKEYVQTILDLGYFYNVFGDWVLNMFAQGGALGSYSAKHGIGPFERFSMGGKGLGDFSLLGKELISLRGYPEGSILPRDQKTGYEGGVLFDKFGLELRHPILKSSNLFIYALAFAEAGNTWGHYKDWKFLELKKSIGVGLRFYLPIIGLIGLDWGYGFDKHRADNLEIHWSMGTSSR